MSWLFSQALVEEFSADTCSDGEPFAQLNVMPTPHKFSRQDRTIEPSDLSRFGLTCAVLTAGRGAALLTWYLADSRARTSARQDAVQAWPAHGRDSGAKWPGSWLRFDRASSTWRTAQFSLLGDSEPFSGTWPRWGSMRNGESCPQPTPELSTSANESGLWPTPNVPNGGRSVAHVTDWRGKTAYHNGRKVQVGLEAAVRMWPTPTASDTGQRSKPYAQGGTPLSLAANLYPTPTTMKSTGGAALCKWGGAGARKKMAAMVTPSEMNGPLNPTWVEWLMGWPTGWTGLTALETAKFHEWQQQHSIFSVNEFEDTP